MNHIIRAALSSKFQAADVDVLMQICAAADEHNSNNVAVQMLLGVYEKPDIVGAPVKHLKYGYTGYVKSYDPFKEEVLIAYKEPLEKRCYYQSEEDMAADVNRSPEKSDAFQFSKLQKTGELRDATERASYRDLTRSVDEHSYRYRWIIDTDDLPY